MTVTFSSGTVETGLVCLSLRRHNAGRNVAGMTVAPAYQLHSG